MTDKHTSYQPGDLVEVSRNTWFYDDYVVDDSVGGRSFFTPEKSVCLVLGTNATMLSCFSSPRVLRECLLLDAQVRMGWVDVCNLRILARGR